MRVYTDGASSKNGHGGWAYVDLESRAFASGFASDTTNQRMEMFAVLKAMLRFKRAESLTVVSDSAYVVNCWRDKWYESWIKRDWMTSGGKPVKNKDLWRPIIMVWKYQPQIKLEHVKGHNGDFGNEMADMLAGQAKVERLNLRGYIQ